MRRVLPIAAIAILSAAGNIALAQREQGPLLIPPSPNERLSPRSNSFGPSPSQAGSGDLRHDNSSPYYLGGRTYFPSSRPSPHVNRPTSPGLEVDTAPIRDPEIGRISEWYQRFHDRRMVAVERHNWEIYLHRDNGSLDKVIVQMLGGDEFYKKSGGNFDSWLRAIAEETGVRLSRDELAHWRDVARRADRLTLAREFLTAKNVIRGPGLVSIPPAGREFDDDFDHHHHQHGGDIYGGGLTNVGGGYYGNEYGGMYGSPFDRIVPSPNRSYGSGYQIPQYLLDNDHDHGHQHSVGYGPRAGGNSPQELIASWYQTYFGRDIAPGELNKWLSDLNKGMSLDEVYASVLAAPEWYTRSGGNPSSWIASTLAALGQRNDGGAVSYWLDRFRRHDGDRFETALEMVRGRNNRDRDDRNRRFDDDD